MKEVLLHPCHAFFVKTYLHTPIFNEKYSILLFLFIYSVSDTEYIFPVLFLIYTIPHFSSLTNFVCFILSLHHEENNRKWK